MTKRLLQDQKERFEKLKTPFYYYDTDLLAETLSAIKCETDKHEGWHLHYAVKACANPKVLRQIQQAGFGADCVSGGEIRTCLENGFPADEIVFAGVGKADWEIELALEAGIQYFNVESIPELEVIAEIATRMNKIANVSFRINPDVGAHTHSHITTGLAENKFGIAKEDMLHVIQVAEGLPSVRFVGLHFHIGSQILQMDDFEALCYRINELQDELEAAGITEVHNINVGGGLGIDYDNPDENPIPDFKSRTWKGCGRAVWLAHHAMSLHQTSQAEAVRYRRCRNDRPDASRTLWRQASHSKLDIFHHTSSIFHQVRHRRSYLRKQRHVCKEFPASRDPSRRPSCHSFGWCLWRNDGQSVQLSRVAQSLYNSGHVTMNYGL